MSRAPSTRLPAPVVEAINRATKQQLVNYLMCEEASGEIFDGLEVPGEIMENGDGSLNDAIERRIAYLEREDEARELCFRRAEARAKGEK